MLSYIKLVYNLYKIKKDKSILLSNEYMSNLKKSIDGCGIIVIKMVQALLPIIEVRKSLDNDIVFNKIKMDLDNYYSNCNEHNIEHTLKLYTKSFNKSLYDDYIIMNLIGSGSVAQVYRIKNKNNNKIYAMKVIHEYTYLDLYYFKIFYFIARFIYRKDILNLDYDDIYNNIINQYSMINEVNNMQLFKHTYETDIIKVPNVIQFSDDIIIMDYIEKDDISDKLKTQLISSIHTLQYYYNLFHGDIHKDNIIYNKDCIYLIDYGTSFIVPNEFNIRTFLNQEFMDTYSNVIDYCIKINSKNNKIDSESVIESFNKEFIELNNYENNHRVHTLYINLFLEKLMTHQIYIPYNLLLVMTNAVYYENNTNPSYIQSNYEYFNIFRKYDKYYKLSEYLNKNIKENIKKRDEDYNHLKTLIKLE